MCEIDKGRDIQSLVAIIAFVSELQKDKWRGTFHPPPLLNWARSKAAFVFERDRIDNFVGPAPVTGCCRRERASAVGSGQSLTASAGTRSGRQMLS